MSKPDSTFEFAIVSNDNTHLGDEEPYQGYWAYLSDDYEEMSRAGGYGAKGDDKGPYPTRGHGNDAYEAIACLGALLSEEAGLPPWFTEDAFAHFVGYKRKPVAHDIRERYIRENHPAECQCAICHYGLDEYIRNFHPSEY